MPHFAPQLDTPSGSFVDLIQSRARQLPNKPSLQFLVDGETQIVGWTYAELDAICRAVAAKLLEVVETGDRALLLFQPGPEFIPAFLGCLYAGVVAVPCYLPRPRRPLDRLDAISADADARLALTSADLLDDLRGRFAEHPRLVHLPWIATDEAARETTNWQPAEIPSEALSFLQYTSGSTAVPKGVMVSHGNLLANSRAIYDSFGHDPDCSLLVWSPPFHDMGLIGGIVQPLYGGLTGWLMSPVHVVQRPIRWLQAISEFRATTSGGPNFIFDHCLRKIAPEDCAGLDLSCWRVAFNGAEPVRASTLEEFTKRLAPYGFRESTFYPCYGMAETTLLTTGGDPLAPPTIRLFDREAMESRHVAEPASEGENAAPHVGCGVPAADHEMLIVDADTCEVLPEGHVGEIWVSGPSVAESYWKRPESRTSTFRVRPRGVTEGPEYLRTGDFGFFHGGELFVTGRLKDLLIVDGRNHYPQDIELTVERAHAALRPAGGAAFAVDHMGERLVVVQEVERNGRGEDLEALVEALREAVSAEHDVAVSAVVLAPVGELPKTSSGKHQRRRCRDQLLGGELEALHAWSDTSLTELLAGLPKRRTRRAAPSRKPEPIAADGASLRAWLVQEVARHLQTENDTIDIHQPLARYGLTSLAALEISGDLEGYLGRTIPPSLIYQYPTIDALARHLTGESPAEEETSCRTAVKSAESRSGGEREPIAVVGLSCRFPGAASIVEYWKNLLGGVDSIGEVPAGRWTAEDETLIRESGQGDLVRRGGFLPRIDGFDCGFFRISPREAACIDPQHRLLSERAWEAFEDAGVPLEQLRGSATGVFTAISTSDYGHRLSHDAGRLDAYWSTGNAGSIAANRLSYFLDLRGPSLTIDTACSSSLVAVLQACRSLWLGEVERALVCGVNLIVSPAVTISFAKAGALSADARCRAFAAGARGIGRSEGAAAVVLKPLSQALADGDEIYALIRGGAINQDGCSNGITAPNEEAQRAVLAAAYCDAGVDLAALEYIETHGAGTVLGDLIEANALGGFLTARSGGEKVRLGSAKTNIGHCEAAAGLAGMIKTVLMLKHRRLAPNLHFDEPNPHIQFDALGLEVLAQPATWRGERPIAGVSAFGFGGTNAHVVLEAAPQEPVSAPKPTEGRNRWLLPLSAASPEALASRAAGWAEELVEGEQPTAEGTIAEGLATSAALRRSHLNQRSALVLGGKADLATQLREIAVGQTPELGVVGHGFARAENKLVFVFSGHGGHRAGMAQELLAQEPVFKRSIEESDRIIRELAGWSLLEQLRADEEQAGLGLSDLQVVQTSVVAVQLALAELWESWGIRPAAVVGHSVGEIAAACHAGILDRRTALRLVLLRSKLLREALEGQTGSSGMAAIRISAADAREAINGFSEVIHVAVQNRPQLTVLAGELTALKQLLQTRKSRKIAGRLMNVPGAGHSPWIEPQRRRLEKELGELEPAAGRVPFYSTVTGGRLAGTELGTEYWGRNLRQPVQFAEAADALIASGHGAFLEIGPTPLLTAALQQCLSHRQAHGTVLASLRQEQPELESLYLSLGSLYVEGFPIRWEALYREPAPVVKLPAYPWQRQRCWLDPTPRTAAPAPEEADTVFTQQIELADSTDVLWQGRLTLTAADAGCEEAWSRLCPAVLEATGQTCGGAWSVGEIHPLTDRPAFPQGTWELQLRLTPNGQTALALLHVRRQGTRRWQPAMEFQLLRGEQAAATAGENAPPLHAENAPIRCRARASDETRRRAALEQYLRGRLADVLSIAPDRIHADQPLMMLGIDSLTALELKNRVEAELEVELPVSDLLQSPTLAKLVTALSNRLAESAPAEAAEPVAELEAEAEETDVPEIPAALLRAVAEDPQRLLRELGDLSDREVSMLLNQMLGEENGA